jgi:murein DD-endopeptidase MepM/ murein hydrolase activator NlpD
MSTYYAHTRRTTPSSEAGVDYYCPIGTPIRAAGDGVIFETGGGIQPATGRYVTLDLNDGRRVRYLHLSRFAANAYGGARVTRGQIIGYAGASGYGSEFFGASSLSRIPANTGGPHVHTTLWSKQVYQFGRYPIEPTLDFELYVDRSAPAGSGATPLTVPTPVVTEEDMPTLITSGGGQSLAIEGTIVPLTSAEEVQSIKISPGRLECAPSVHARIHALVGKTTLASFPVIVHVPNQPQKYLLGSDGTLTPVADAATLSEIVARGGVAMNMSQAEVDNLRNR